MESFVKSREDPEKIARADFVQKNNRVHLSKLNHVCRTYD